MNLKNCKLIIKDPLLSKQIGNKFDNIEDFKKALKKALLIDKKAIPVSLDFKGAKGVAKKLKFLQVIDTENGLEVQVTLPNLELGKNLKGLVKGAKVNKYSIVIPDINTELGKASDLDTLATLFLGNYFLPDASNIKSVLENQVPKVLEAKGEAGSKFLNSVIGDDGIIDYYLSIAKDFNVGIDPEMAKAIAQKRASLSIGFEPVFIDNFKDYEEKEQMAPEPITKTTSSKGLIFKTFSTSTDELDLARQALILGLEGETRIKVVRSSTEFVQPLNKGVPLTSAQVNSGKGIVAIIEKKENGVWKPVYLKSKPKVFEAGKLTTDKSEAYVFDYKIDDTNLRGSQLYLSVPSQKRAEFEQLLTDGKEITFRIEATSVDSEYKSFKERGVTLDQIFIPDKEAPFGVRGVPELRGPKGIELISIGTLTDGEDLHKEVLGLMEGDYKSFQEVSKVISYLNEILMLGEFTTPKDVQTYEEALTKGIRITSRGIGFYPYKEGDTFKIEYSVERYKSEGGYVTEPNQTPVRTITPKVKLALLGQRIRVPKTFEGNSVGNYTTRLYYENGIKEKSWPKVEQEEYLSGKLSTRLTQVNGKLGYAENYVFTYDRDRLEVSDIQEIKQDFPVGVKPVSSIIGEPLSEQGELVYSLLKEGKSVNFLSDSEMNKLGTDLIAAYTNGQIYLRASQINKGNVKGYVLEELIHAYTAENLESQKDTVEYQELDRLRNHLRDTYSIDRVQYYTESMEEFVTSLTMPFMQDLMNQSGFVYESSNNQGIYDYILSLLNDLMTKIASIFYENPSIQEQVTFDLLKLVFNRTTKVQQFTEQTPEELKPKRSLINKKKLLGSFDRVPEVPVAHLDMLLSNLAWDMKQFADLLNGELDAELVKKVLKEELELEAQDSTRAEYLKPFLDNFDSTFETWLSSSKLAELEVKDKTQEDTETKFQDRTESLISSVDAGTKYARVFIKMIPKILLEDGEPVMDGDRYVYARDKNGNYIPSDYTTLWNSIADLVQGSLDIEEIKEKLKGYKKLPEMNIVLERLEQLTGTGDNAYEEMFILKGIEQSFSKVLVPTIIIKQKVEAQFSDDFLEREDFVDPEFGSEEILKSSTYSIFESGRLDAQNIKNAMLDSFKRFTDNQFEELTLKALVEYLNNELKSGRGGYTELSIKKVMKLFGVNITSQMESYPNVRGEVYSASSNFLTKLIAKLEYVKDTELEMTFDVFDFLENSQKVGDKIYNGYKGVVLDFQNTMSKYLPYSTSNMTKNPEGKNQSNLHNFSSYLLNIKFINEGQFDRVERLRNPIAKYSLALNAVRGGAKIMPLNVSGTEFVDRGTNTISLGTIEYVRQELVTVLEGGFKENLRAETASSSFGYRIAFNKSSTAAGTYLPLSRANTLEEAKLQFKQYLKGELERVWLERKEPTKYGSRFYENKKTGLTFFSFLDDTFLTDLDLISVDQIDQFVEEREAEFYEQFENYFSAQKQDFKNWIQAETGQVLDAKHPVFLSQLKKQAEEDLEGLLDRFLLNSLILSIEEIILFHGELGQFDKIYKRLKSNISNGTPFVLSDAAQMIFKERLQGGTFSEVYGVRPEYYNDTTKMKSIVLKEAKMKASPEQINNLVEGAKNSLKMTDEFFGRTPENLDERAAEVVAPYGNSSKEDGPSSDISDGEGWVFPDAYRIMCQAVNSWSKDKEEGFQYLAIKFKKKKGFIISEREQELSDYVENRIKEEGWYFQFPKLKFQYRGSAKPANGTTNVAVELLDKFALTPIFPEFIEGTIAEQHFEQMAKQGIAYGKFQSGTKLGTFNADDWNVVKEYESVHEIDTVYLKEQVKTPDYIKTENLMGSQKRKLVLSNISLNGEFMDSLKSAVRNWIEGQRELAENARKVLMEDLGAEDGQVDVYKVVELIKGELESRDLPLAYTELFDNYSGQNLEESLSPQSVETLIYSLLKNRIVKAKFPGGQLVQVSSALFGAETLEFYRYENGQVLPADCMVTLSGDFLNLLNLPEVTNNTLEELNELLKDPKFRNKYKKELTLSAYRIPTQGLNSMDIFMVKKFLPQWMGNTIVPPPQIVTKSGTDYDYDKQSVILPSIGKNGRYIREARKEYLEEKYEKLYDKLILDIDTLKARPNLKILNSLAEQFGFNVEEDLIQMVKSKLIKSNEIISKKDFIQAAKDRVFKQVKHNKVLEASKDIVLAPANFHRLITPNTDALIKEAVEEVTSKLYPGVGKVNAEPQLSKVFSYTTHLKKWKAVKIKDLLGIGAVANTFYTLMQTVNFKLNNLLYINEVGFEFNVPLLTEDEQKLVSISNPFIIDEGVTTVDKLEIINQFINITVDAASNDIAGYTNLIAENTGFVMFQTMLGVPLPRIMKLLHQPEVYEYHQKIAVLVGKGYSRGEAKKEVMLELLEIEPTFVSGNGVFPKSNKKIWEEIRKIGYTSPLKLREIQPLGSKSTFNKEILVYYLVGLAQSDALRKVQSDNNFDTRTEPSYKMSNIQEENPDVEVDGLFNVESSEQIHNNSVISHLNVHEEFKQISESAFRIKNYKPYVDFVTDKASNIFTSKDREKFVRVIDNDFLMAIIQNFGTQDLIKIQNLMTGPLMDTWANLKEKYPELNDTVLGSKLIADRYEDFVNPMYFVGLDNDTSTYNTLAQDIQNLLEGTPDQAQFAKDLVRVAFFQSGFNQSKLYMLKGIPPKMITAITSEAYTAFENLSVENKKQFISKFWNKFLQNRVLEFGKSFPKEYSGEVNFVKSQFDKRNFRFMKYGVEMDTNQTQLTVSETPQVPSTNYTEHILYSGDAVGADKLWAAQSKEFGVGRTVNYKVETLNSLTKPQQEEVEAAYLKAKNDLGRKTLSYNWANPQKEDYVGGLVRRDYLQAKAADAIFAISDIIGVGEKGKPVKSTRYTSKSSKEIVDGGTGYAVQMAINLGKPVYVFHQGTNTDNKASVGWYKWDYNTEKFVPVLTPVLTKKFAGIGTREINEAGKTAIKEVFSNSKVPAQAEISESMNENSPLLDDKAVDLCAIKSSSNTNNIPF